MPLDRKNPRKRVGGSTVLADTRTFSATIESASSVPSFEDVPREYKRRLLRNIKKILKRKHSDTVVREMSKGENRETYNEDYAKRKDNQPNVRRLKAIIDGNKKYTAAGPVDFVKSGQLYNSLGTRTRVKGNEVRSSVVVKKNRRIGKNEPTNKELIEILDGKKNFRSHATEAVGRKQDSLIIATIKKAIAQTNAQGSGGKKESFF
jgi:hypothetical protein